MAARIGSEGNDYIEPSGRKRQEINPSNRCSNPSRFTLVRVFLYGFFRIGLSPGMRRFIRTPQPVQGDVGINLCGCDSGMAEKFLDEPDVGATV